MTSPTISPKFAPKRWLTFFRTLQSVLNASPGNIGVPSRRRALFEKRPAPRRDAHFRFLKKQECTQPGSRRRQGGPLAPWRTVGASVTFSRDALARSSPRFLCGHQNTELKRASGLLTEIGLPAASRHPADAHTHTPRTRQPAHQRVALQRKCASRRCDVCFPSRRRARFVETHF